MGNQNTRLFKAEMIKGGFDVGERDADKNELAFAELVQYLDKRSLSIVMRKAKDNAREALRILKAHYTESGKPRIITLYNQRTNLKKRHSESIIDYIIKAETKLMTKR